MSEGKKKTKTRIKHPVMLVFSLLLMIGFAVAAFVGAQVTRGLTGEYFNLNELSPETAYDGQIVYGQVYASLGTYGQKYKLDENGDIISENDMDYFYLVQANDDYSITIQTDDHDMAASLDALTAASDRFAEGETDSIEYDTIEYSGMLIPLDEDELNHLYAWVLQQGRYGATTVEEAAQYIIPYKICDYNRNGGLPLLIVGCVGFVGFAVIMLRLLKQRVEVENDEI
ncbi:MAG: DUF6709 family protein [Oscillospiraceae bacterium]|nr:hypothetical protein [Oscillospiraceae bacterium]MDD7429139.1 hypothetical protein [Oscillospiraceae bacterium]MDY2847124.1 DUF6709 family protein [Oscillospiraceae bacterium]